MCINSSSVDGCIIIIIIMISDSIMVDSIIKVRCNISMIRISVRIIMCDNIMCISSVII